MKRGVFIGFFSLGVVRWEPAFFDILGPLLLLVGLASGRLRLAQGRSDGLFFGGCYLFCLVQLITVAASPDPVLSLRYTLITVLLVGMGALSYMVAASADLMRPLINGYVAGAFVTTAIGILVYQGVVPRVDPDLVTYSGLRFMGFFKDANVLAPYLIFALVLLGSADLAGRRINGPVMRRTVMTAVALTLVYGIVIAYSRAALLNLFVTLVVYVGLRILRSPRSIGIRLLQVTIVIVAAFLAYEAVPFVRDVLSQRQLGLERQDTIRFATQRESWEAFKASPLDVRGPGSSAESLGLGIHNVYLQQLYETGVWGFIPFMLLQIEAMRRAVVVSVTADSERHAKLAAAIAAGLVGLAVNSLFIDSVHWRHMWILFGLGWAVAAWPQRRSASTRVHTWLSRASSPVPAPRV